jgi:hypothetical protein
MGDFWESPKNLCVKFGIKTQKNGITPQKHGITTQKRGITPHNFRGIRGILPLNRGKFAKNAIFDAF